MYFKCIINKNPESINDSIKMLFLPIFETFKSVTLKMCIILNHTNKIGKETYLCFALKIF